MTDAASEQPLDIERHEQLVEYLRASGRIAPTETPQVRTLAGGVSNRTVLVKRASGEAWVLKQALAKLRVKVDWFSDPARIRREALGLRWLEKLAPPGTITPLIFEDERHHLLAMQAVPEPHENWKTMLLRGDVELDHVRQFAHLLGTIHRAASARRDELEPVFADRSFFESLRVEPYYAYTAAQVPEARPFLAGLIEETRSRRYTLVHGDYSPKNILVHDGRLVLLDHEVIHWGDGAFDVGFALTHLLSKMNHLPRSRVVLSGLAIQFHCNYDAALGIEGGDRELAKVIVRHTLGCMLARVAGKSPLEYLTEPQRQRQLEFVVDAMRSPPATVPALVAAFTHHCEESDAGN